MEKIVKVEKMNLDTPRVCDVCGEKATRQITTQTEAQFREQEKTIAVLLCDRCAEMMATSLVN